MATEKENVDVGGSEKQEKVANPNEVEERDLNEVAGNGREEKAEEKGEEAGEELNGEDDVTEVKEEELRDEQVEEGNLDEGEAEVKEKDEDEDDEGNKLEVEESEEKTESSKKGSRKVKRGKSRELGSPRTPAIERPTRERKTVERFMVGGTPKALASKTLSIEKGQGTQLKDIPNVAFKLSKRKADENLQILHTILFGKKSKVHSLKKNIGLFSGFVWTEMSQEKQRAKLKEKLEKCVKEKLMDFCDVLNISANKASTRKEELSAKLLEFLESPHATTDRLLADKEKVKKRKSKARTSKSPSSSGTAGKSKKKQKLDAESGKKSKPSTEELEEEEAEEDEGDNKSESSQNEDDSTVREAESDKEEVNSEGTDGDDDDDEPKKQIVVEKTSAKESGKKDTGKTEAKSKSIAEGRNTNDSKPGKPTKKSPGSTSKKETETERKVKTPSSKKKKEDDESEEDPEVPTKGASSSMKKLSKSSVKEQGKGKGKAAGKQPSREEMHGVVANMLKEVDFNKATLSDILRQLGKHFGVDLIHRKAEVKEIITEVIESMSDDEGEEEAAASGDGSDKDGDEE